MKKIISLILAASLALSCGVCATAAEKNDDNPTILISGFLCSQLYINFGKENEEKVWTLNMDKVTSTISDDLPKLLTSIAGLAIGRKQELGETIGDGAAEILEYLRCNPDGSSAYPLEFYPNDPQKSNLKYMYENGLEDKLYEKNFCEHLSKTTDPSRVYCFQYDSRLDAITIAEQLNDFIKEVKAYTGCEKVNIFALSFGGLIASTYLSLYGDNNDAARIVMSVPAIGGTDIPDSIFRGKIDFPMDDIVMFFETILGGEGNIARYFNGNYDGLSEVIAAATDGISSALLYWGSMWSLVSTDLYDDLKKDFLDSEESKAIIEKNDILHYEIRPHFAETFNKFKQNGGSISILCATGSPIATGTAYNSDLVLPVSSVSGATCAPLGKRFTDGYTGIGSSCNNREHNHISPSMEIDATSAYLPENTWFIEKQYHGQYYYEEYTRSLVTKLLLTDEIEDVHSNPGYPQFEYSSHQYRSIHVKFNASPTGYLGKDDTAIIIKNLSSKNRIKILAVDFYGADLDFDISDIETLEPNSEVTVSFTGKVPEKSASAAQISISYIEFDSMNPLCISDFAITINNGKAQPNKGGTVPIYFETNLEKALPSSLYGFLSKLSIQKSVECIYNAVKAVI